MATLYFTGNGTQWDNLANWWTNSARTTPASSLPLPTDDIDAIVTGNFAYSASPIVANSIIFRGTAVNICFARSLNIATTATFIGLYDTFPISSSLPIHQLSTGVNQPLTITADTLSLKHIGMGFGSAGTGSYKCGAVSTTAALATFDVNNLNILENCIIGPLGPSLTIKDNCNITIGKKYNIVSSTNTSPISITLDSPHEMTMNLSANYRQIIIENHTINTNANGSWTFTVTGPNTLTLNGSTGNGVGGNTGQAMYLDNVSNRQGLRSVDLRGVVRPIIGNNFNIVCNGTTGFGTGGLDDGVLGILFASNNHNITLNDRSGTQKNIITSINNIILDGNKRGRYYPSNSNSMRLYNSTINGNIELKGRATPFSVNYGDPYGTVINGNIICSQSVYPNNPIEYGSTVHNGTVTFTSATPVIFRLTENEKWHSGPGLSSATFTAGAPTIECNDTSSLLSSTSTVSIDYDVTFNDSTNIPAIYAEYYYQPTQPVVVTTSGDMTFNDSSYLLGKIVASNQSVISFNGNSFNAGQISGGASINYNGFTGTNAYGSFINGQKRTALNIPITVTNLATFGGASMNQNTLTGNCIFKNNSTNLGIITGNVIFRNNAYNAKDIGGTVTLDYDKGVNGSSILGIV